jgi:porin
MASRRKGDACPGLFRPGGSRARRQNTVPLYFDIGFNFRGILPSHVDDTLGLGFSYTQPSDGLMDKGGIEIGGGYEGVVELTYRLSLIKHVFLQPDLQFIIHPGAGESAVMAVVAGLRLRISY